MGQGTRLATILGAELLFEDLVYLFLFSFLFFFFFFLIFLWFSFELRSGRNLVNIKRSLAAEAFALVLTLAFCPAICSEGGGGEGAKGGEVVV